MNKKYSNIKKTALGLLVVGLAISTQAFKKAEKAAYAENDLYAWNGTEFVLIPSGTYDENLCGSGQELSCAYRVTAAGEPFVSGVTIPENTGRGYIEENTPYLVPDPSAQVGNYDITP